MHSPTLTIVSGFGRCGSSLVMQMLAAGGYPTVGEYPAYEVEAPEVLTEAFLAAHDGMAIKVLDLHVYPLPVGPAYRVIWLDRDYRQQARSMAKFLGATVGACFDRADLGKLKRSYAADRPKVFAALFRMGARVLPLRFELLVGAPNTAALRLAQFLGGGLGV